MRLIVSHCTAAEVWRLATAGPRRRRLKYQHGLTVACVLNRREAPLLAMTPAGYGVVGEVKFSWGFGWIDPSGSARAWLPGQERRVDTLDAMRRWARGLTAADLPSEPLAPRPHYGWSNTESRSRLRGAR